MTKMAAEKLAEIRDYWVGQLGGAEGAAGIDFEILLNHISAIEAELTDLRRLAKEYLQADLDYNTKSTESHDGYWGAAYKSLVALKRALGEHIPSEEEYDEIFDRLIKMASTDETTEKGEDRLAEATKLLQEVEWKGGDTATCPICLGEKYEEDFSRTYNPHLEGCELAAFLKSAQ